MKDYKVQTVAADEELQVGFVLLCQKKTDPGC